MSKGIFKNPIERNIKISKNNACYWKYHKQSKEHRQNIEKAKQGIFVKKKYYCVDCNKELFRKAKTSRCVKCSKLWQIANGTKIGFQKNHRINNGKKKTLETRLKMGEWQKGKPKLYLRLEKHWNWLGGKSFEPYSIEWTEELREKIRCRDNYKCQVCGTHQDKLLRKLTVHHIDYDKENCDPDNLISLCISCHMQTNFNREYWQEYFLNTKLLLCQDFHNSKLMY